MDTLAKIELFISEHHVMSLATSFGEELSVCALFYAYNPSKKQFIFASSRDTKHIEQIEKFPKVAANILLETKSLSAIKGVQIQGVVTQANGLQEKKIYFKAFPYAALLLPTLWVLSVDSFKMSDNSLGFGKKLIWQRS